MRSLAIILSLICVNVWAEVTSDQFNQWRLQAEQGDADAQFNIGVCYKNGEHVQQNQAEGVKWYRKAAEQGNGLAQFNLGQSYYYGTGVITDRVEALKWYRKAAEQGHAQALLNLGFAYSMGEGVLQDRVEAFAYYNVAGITDDKARRNRDILEKKMTPAQIEAGITRSKELQKEIEKKITAKTAK